MERLSELAKLPITSMVLGHNSKIKTWYGLFQVTHIGKGTLVVQMDHGHRIFRSSCFKPLLEQTINEWSSQTIKARGSKEPAVSFRKSKSNNRSSTSFAENRDPFSRTINKENNQLNWKRYFWDSNHVVYRQWYLNNRINVLRLAINTDRGYW